MSLNKAEEKYWVNYKSVDKFTMPLHFANHLGFLCAFKKWTGLTPSEFRSKLFS